MATPYSVDFSGSSTSAGNQLVFTFSIYDGCGNQVTQASELFDIIIFTGTSQIDATRTIQVLLTGTELVQADTSNTLIDTYTLTGYTTAVKYACSITARLKGDFFNPCRGFLSTTVRGGIQNITPIFVTGEGYPVPYDNRVRYYLDASSASTCESYMKNYDASGAAQYANLFVFTYGNNDTDTEAGTFPSDTVSWITFKNNGYSFYLDQSNNIEYEVYAYYGYYEIDSALNGISNTTDPGQEGTSTDRPNPPSQIATVSKFEFNRDNTTNPFAVTSSSNVCVLFNEPTQDFGTEAVTYKIYRTDLSNNGYDTVGSAAVIGVVTHGVTSSNVYNGVDYSYNYIDTTAVPGRFYGYQISGVNANGEGVLSTPLKGVKDGSKAGPSSYTNIFAGNSQIIATMTPPTSLGGFTLDASYTLFYSTSTGDSSGVVVSPSPITINGLLNNRAYTLSTWAQTSNSNYTDNYDVSGGLNGSLLSYYSSVVVSESITPYTTAPAPTSVSVAPLIDISANPTGNVRVSWMQSDSSFGGVWISYVVNTYDASSGQQVGTAIRQGISTPSDPSGVPAPKFYVDTGVTDGIEYYYTVASRYTVGNPPTDVLSLPTRSSNTNYQDLYTPDLSAGNVIPFVYPTAPALGEYTFDNSAQLVFSLIPISNGGLTNVEYYYAVDVSGSGPGTFTLTPPNTPITVPLAPNQYVTIRYKTVTTGPNALGNTTAEYTSTIGSTPAGPSIYPPFITGNTIDASGILTILTNNNGSALTFAEGLILDASGILLVSYCTNPSAPTISNTYPNTTVFQVISNTTSASQIKVNFSDPQIETDSSQLVVIANSAGADVFNSL